MQIVATLAIATLLAAKPLPYEVAAKPVNGSEDTIIIALRGAASTTRFYCGQFVKGRYEKLARERGYILICAAGVGIKPLYEDYEQQLLELREHLLLRYPTVKRVFLAGHSLGARGALVLGLRHPDKFDAVAAIAPSVKQRKDQTGTVPAIMEQLVAYPHSVFLAYGLLDFIAPLALDDVAKLTLTGAGRVEPHPYATDHWRIAAESAEDMFNFFDRQRGSAKLVQRD